MQILALLAALAAIFGLASSSGKDEDEDNTYTGNDDSDNDRPIDDDDNQPESDDDDPDDDGFTTAGNGSSLTINLSYEDDLDPGIIAEAEASALRISGLMESAETADTHTIDIQVTEAYIDGSGGAAGQASVSISGGDTVPDTATIIIDSADTDRMISQGVLDELMDHEMLHAIGAGTVWGLNGLIDDTSEGPVFTGENAIAAYEELTGENVDGVPLDDHGHWDAGDVPNDILNPFVTNASEITDVTLASLQDIGYQVDADAFGQEDEDDMLGGMIA